MSTKMIQPLFTKDLGANEFAEYFQRYLDKVGDVDVMQLLHTQSDELHEIFDTVENSEAEKLHEPYTWTLKQVLGHVIDVEKVFGERAHRIAFGKDQSLPGFDHNQFVNDADFSQVSVSDLAKEFDVLRQSNCLMMERLTAEMWDRTGLCDDKSISTRAIACLLAGHFIHHVDIAKSRLGK